MAQNITIQGASYSDVPSVTLPKTGGGTAYFTDVTATTATESDVASGKIFYKSDGSQAVGSHVDSGGTTEDGNGDIELGKTGNVALITPLSVTANGTYTAATNTGYSPVNVNVSGGGGSSGCPFPVAVKFAGSLQNFGDTDVSWDSSTYTCTVVVNKSGYESGFGVEISLDDGSLMVEGTEYEIVDEYESAIAFQIIDYNVFALTPCIIVDLYL